MSVTKNVAPVTINFSNTSQGDGLSYAWNFGDGLSSQQANPTHTFQVGVWEVTLTVTNDNGTDTSSTVIVATEPVASGGGNSTDDNGGSSSGLTDQLPPNF